jgi:HSP20 family protein
MKLDTLKENLGSFWDNMAEGWRHLRQSAAEALTRFNPGEKTNMPARAEVDDDAYLPTMGWSMLGGDMFEDDKRLVIRLEVPGMEKEDLDIQIHDDSLLVTGEKRFERESSEGRWRVMQRAYGSFRQRGTPAGAGQGRPSPCQLQEWRATCGVTQAGGG